MKLKSNGMKIVSRNRYWKRITFLCLLPTAVNAQITFESTYGGVSSDRGYSVQETSDGGYIIAGSTVSFGAGGQDFYLIKTDSLGDTLWTRTFGGSFDEISRSVQQTSKGGYIITGYTRSFGAGLDDVYLINTNPLGDTLWSTTFGGTSLDYGYSVQETSDGGYIITGSTLSFGAGGEDIYLIKIDSLGDTLWTKTYGGSNSDIGNSVKESSDGGYIIAGWTSSFGAGSFDFYLIKTDSIGDTLWSKTFGGSAGDWCYSVQRTSDGGYVLAGYSFSFGAAAYLVKTDSSGGTLWTRTHSPIETNVYSVQQTSDKGYILTGSIFPGDVYVIKTDSLGDSLWTRFYGGGNSDGGRSIQQSLDGGFVIAGYTFSFGSGGRDVYLIKTDSLGGIHDGGVISLDAPGDTLLTDSTYVVMATVRNFGNVPETLDVSAVINGYADTVQVPALAPNSSFQISFQDWQVPSADSTSYTMTVCTYSPYDFTPMNNCVQKIIFARTAIHDCGAISIISPDDTVFTNFTYNVRALVRNFGNVLENFDVIAEIGGYADTFQVTNLFPNSSAQVIFRNWQVPATDSTIYIMTVCTELMNDADTTNDCIQKPIFAYNPLGIQESISQILTTRFELRQNSPNPFHSTSIIMYSLPAGREQSQIKLEVFDISGRLVETLVDMKQKPGVYQVQWDGKDQTSGIYFYRLTVRIGQVDNFVRTKKIVLLH
jgi:hypothetical protein